MLIHKYTNIQLTSLVILRVLIGWHLLYEGISKLLIPNWSAKGFLAESQWIMSGIAHWMVSNENIMQVVDFVNIWGLIAIGSGLIFGLFARQAAIGGAILLLVYYFNNAPIIGIEYSIPSEGNYLLVSKTLIEAVALSVLAIFPTSSIIGLDIYVEKLIKKNRNE